MKKVEQENIEKIQPQDKKVQNDLSTEDHGEETVRKRFQIQFDFDYVPSKGKLMSQKVETVPDLNLTVRQLLQNHTRGIDGGENVRQPLYFDFPIPNVRDITDVMEYKEFLKERMAQVEEFMKSNPLEENQDKDQDKDQGKQETTEGH